MLWIFHLTVHETQLERKGFCLVGSQWADEAFFHKRRAAICNFFANTKDDSDDDAVAEELDLHSVICAGMASCCLE